MELVEQAAGAELRNDRLKSGLLRFCKRKLCRDLRKIRLHEVGLCGS
jgi:hypothetical protein